MSAPPLPMRHVIHSKGRRYLFFAAPVSVAAALAWYALYTDPRRKKYEKFFEEYDPYVRMQEICAYPIKYLHTCPSVLLERAEEAGLQVAAADNLYRAPKSLRPDPEEEFKQIPSLPVS